MIESNEFMLSFDPNSPDNQTLSEKWTEIEFAMQMLGISDEEEKGIWAILAAICHLGCAGISVGRYNIYCNEPLGFSHLRFLLAIPPVQKNLKKRLLKIKIRLNCCYFCYIELTFIQNYVPQSCN